MSLRRGDEREGERYEDGRAGAGAGDFSLVVVQGRMGWGGGVKEGGYKIREEAQDNLAKEY